MYDHQNVIRYPFIITDDAGYVILSDPEIFEQGECFFAPENFSSEELSFLFERVRGYRLGNLLLLKERKKGRAVFVSPFLFSSGRTLVAVVSDIDYDIVAAICSFSYSDVAKSHVVKQKLGKKNEKTYESVGNILYLLKSATCSYSYGEDFYKYLEGMVKAISKMTFCKASVDFEPAYSIPENFDSAILGLYLLIMMSAASFASPKRSMEIKFYMENDYLRASLKFSAIMDEDLFSDFEKKFSSAVAMLDGICAENNLPMYFYSDGIFKSGIIPCRIENNLLGLKARTGYLKDEQKEEQKERNVFFSAFFSANE